MCGRYNFTVDTPDEKMAALVRMMEKRYPGGYRTGEICPGDTAPGIGSGFGEELLVLQLAAF